MKGALQNPLKKSHRKATYELPPLHHHSLEAMKLYGRHVQGVRPSQLKTELEKLLMIILTYHQMRTAPDQALMTADLIQMTTISMPT